MNPYNIRQLQDRRKVYNEYLANLKMQINNLSKTEAAVAALEKTGVPPVQPTDTRTLSEKLLDIDKQKQILRQALLEVTDGAEASKIMNTISDEDVVFLGMAWGDFSKMVKQKFASGILAPIFNELLQRYKRDYINSISAQQGISSGRATEELILSMRELLRLMPNAAQLRDLRFTITNVPAGVIPERLRTAALDATDELGALIPTDTTIQELEKMNPIDRAEAEKAYNDGLSSITTGAVLQDLTSQLQQASPKEIPNILNSIIKDIVLTRDDRAQLEQAKAIAEAKKGVYEAKEGEFKSAVGKKKAAVLTGVKEVKEKRAAKVFQELPPEEAAIMQELASQKGISPQLEYDINFVENSSLEDITKFMTVPRLRAVLTAKSREGVIPLTKAEINKLAKVELIGIVEAIKSGSQVAEPPRKVASTKKAKKKPSTSIFIQEEYDPNMSTAEFEKKDYADKRSILEDADTRGLVKLQFDAFFGEDVYPYFVKLMNKNDPTQEQELVESYRALRQTFGFKGEGMKSKKGKRITFGCGLVSATKPRMMVKPDNIDFQIGIKKEASYIPIGKYVVNKHKLRDNVLLMRTVKGGQIAELPQMTVSPKLGKMLNKIIHGNGFPSHDELSELEDSDKDIMFKVFKMSKAEGIDAIPRPNKTKDEAEFNRFTILKGQILAGNNSKELIKEFKTLLVKLMHSNKILRKDGHDILIDLAALGF